MNEFFLALKTPCLIIAWITAGIMVVAILASIIRGIANAV